MSATWKNHTRITYGIRLFIGGSAGAQKITVVICVVLYPDFTVTIIPFIILGLIVLGERAGGHFPPETDQRVWVTNVTLFPFD